MLAEQVRELRLATSIERDLSAQIDDGARHRHRVGDSVVVLPQ
jgi:hypothetical protein